MSMIWTNTVSGVPPGAYVVQYKGNEPTTHEQYGSGLNWLLEVQEGAHKGTTIKKMTGDKPTPKNACGQTIVSLLGRTPNEGEDVDNAVKGCVGKKYSVIVGQTDKGARVQAIAPLA